MVGGCWGEFPQRTVGTRGGLCIDHKVKKCDVFIQINFSNVGLPFLPFCGGRPNWCGLVKAVCARDNAQAPTCRACIGQPSLRLPKVAWLWNSLFSGFCTFEEVLWDSERSHMWARKNPGHQIPVFSRHLMSPEPASCLQPCWVTMELPWWSAGKLLTFMEISWSISLTSTVITHHSTNDFESSHKINLKERDQNKSKK